MVDIMGSYTKNNKSILNIQVIEQLDQDVVDKNSKKYISKVTVTYVFIHFLDENGNTLKLKSWEIAIPNQEGGDHDHVFISDFNAISNIFNSKKI